MRRPALGVFLILWASYAFWWQARDWNSASRLMLTYALVGGARGGGCQVFTHTRVEDIERDRRKDTWLQIRGIRILRVTDKRWKRDRKGVHHDLTALLALAPEHRVPQQRAA